MIHHSELIPHPLAHHSLSGDSLNNSTRNRLPSSGPVAKATHHPGDGDQRHNQLRGPDLTLRFGSNPWNKHLLRRSSGLELRNERDREAGRDEIPLVQRQGVCILRNSFMGSLSVRGCFGMPFTTSNVSDPIHKLIKLKIETGERRR